MKVEENESTDNSGNDIVDIESTDILTIICDDYQREYDKLEQVTDYLPFDIELVFEENFMIKSL